MASKPMNKKQEVVAILSSSSKALRDYLKDDEKMGSLTEPARDALADGLIESQRWADVAVALKAGRKNIFSGWREAKGYGNSKRRLSKHLSLDAARGLDSTGEHGLKNRVVKDLAERVQEGDWQAWTDNAHEDALIEKLFEGREGGFTLRCVLVAEEDEASKMPEDLRRLAFAAAAGSPHWRSDLEPEITSWGSFSRRSGADVGSGSVHALFCHGNWRSAVAVARHFGIEEYGGSGYGPLDSAFHSRVFEAVEELTRINPLLAIGPVESVKHDRKTSRIPLVCFFEDLKNSGGWSRVLGLTRKSTVEGEDYAGLEEIARKWIGTAYDVAGSLEDKKQWQSEIEMFKKASDTGKLRVDEALDALSAMATEASKRLAIPPKQSKSLKQALSTPKGAAALLNKESWEKRWEDDEQNRLNKAMERLAQVAGAPPLADIALKVAIQRAEAVGSSQRGAVTASEISAMADAMSIAEEKRERKEVPAPSVADTKDVAELNSLAIVAKIEKRRTVVYNKEQTGVLSRAVAQGDAWAARAALRAGGDPNGRIGSGDLMLHRAASLASEKQSLELVELLLSGGADSMRTSPGGMSALDQAKHDSSAALIQQAMQVVKAKVGPGAGK